MAGPQSTPRTDESTERQAGASPRQGESRQGQGGASPRQSEGQGESREGGTRQGASKTAGTNRDFDESGESMNQGHGHTRGDQASRPPRGNE